jgi:hypothetical protein
MPYSQFTFSKVKEQFDLTILEGVRFFPEHIAPIAPSPKLLAMIESIGLFLGVWIGKKAEQHGSWLRWWDRSENLLLWGSELVEQQRQLVGQQRQLTEQAEQRANRLAEKLRSLGIEVE